MSSRKFYSTTLWRIYEKTKIRDSTLLSLPLRVIIVQFCWSCDVIDKSNKFCKEISVVWVVIRQSSTYNVRRTLKSGGTEPVCPSKESVHTSFVPTKPGNPIGPLRHSRHRNPWWSSYDRAEERSSVQGRSQSERDSQNEYGDFQFEVLLNKFWARSRQK